MKKKKVAVSKWKESESVARRLCCLTDLELSEAAERVAVIVVLYYSYSSWREPLTDVKVTVVAAAVSVAFLAPLPNGA